MVLQLLMMRWKMEATVLATTDVILNWVLAMTIVISETLAASLPFDF